MLSLLKAEFNRNHGGGHTGHAPKEDFYDPEIWKVKALENAKRWKGLYVRYLKARFQPLKYGILHGYAS